MGLPPSSAFARYLFLLTQSTSDKHLCTLCTSHSLVMHWSAVCQVVPELTYLAYPVNVLLWGHNKVDGWDIWDWVTIWMQQPWRGKIIKNTRSILSTPAKTADRRIWISYEIIDTSTAILMNVNVNAPFTFNLQLQSAEFIFSIKVCGYKNK